MTIGKRISELRKAKGYTQEYVAEQLGVSRQAVSKWEKDLTSPDTKNLIALSKLFGATVEYIAVGGDGDQKSDAQAQAKQAFKEEYFMADLLLFLGFAGFIVLTFFNLQLYGVVCMFGCAAAGFLVNRKGRKLEKKYDEEYGAKIAPESDEKHRINLHNLYVSCATFLLLFGIALTLVFPFFGPYLIVASIVFMVLAVSKE